MHSARRSAVVARRAACAIALWSTGAVAQGTAADYARSEQLNARYQSLALNVADHQTWIGKTSRFWYRRSVKGGYEFMRVDAATLEKRVAFDHAKVAQALDAATGSQYTAVTLPFSDLTFTSDERSIEFVANSSAWRCTLADVVCARTGPAPTGGRGGRGAGPALDGQSDDVVPFEGPWDDDDGLGNEVLAQRAQQRAATPPDSENVRRSPDGKSEALIHNFNVYLRPVGSRESTPLTYDGSEGSAYTLQSIAWSPDATKIAVYRVTPGYRRLVRYVESSPADQLQPKYMERVYAKPGDVLDLREPVLIDVQAKKATHVESSAFPNAYQLTALTWRKDSRAFTFEYNQRGHQMYRVIEVSAASGAPRVVISEEPRTFFNYRTANGSLTDSGKKYRFDVADGKEVVWMSERDGWNHLYLYDGVTGRVKNQITRGSWVVRSVERVDEAKRQIWFAAGGMNPKQDPYFTQYFRINFDGTGLTPLTEADGIHVVDWSADSTFYLDKW